MSIMLSVVGPKFDVHLPTMQPLIPQGLYCEPLEIEQELSSMPVAGAAMIYR